MSISTIIIPNFIQRSFLVKLLLGVVTVMLLTGAVGGFFYQGISDDLDSQVDRQVEASIVHHETAYANWFNNRDDELDDILRQLKAKFSPTEFRELEPGDISGELRLAKGQTGIETIRDIHWVNPDTGEVIASTNDAFVGEVMTGSDGLGYDAETFQQEQFVLPSQYTAADNTAVMGIGKQVPITGVNAVLIGEIPAFERGPRIEQSIRGAETGVISRNGELIHANDSSTETNILQENVPSELSDSVQTKSTGSDIYAYLPFEDYENLVVVTRTPTSSAFQLRDAVLTNFGLTLVLAFLILGLVMGAGGWFATRDLNTLANRAKQMGEGDLDIDLATDRKDEIGVLYDEFDDMRNDLKERIQEAESARDEAESARKEAEVARAEAEEMADYLQEKAEEYSEIMQEVGMGDLTQRMTKDGEEESMDRIAEEFNDMIEELEKTTGQLKSYVNEVEEAGAEVEQSADTVRDASEQVADSIQKISDDAYDQKERLQNISEMMDQVTDDLATLAADHDVDIEGPVSHIREIASDISEVVELSEETMAESQHVAGAAEEQAAELNEVSERANDLQRYAQPLRDILERFETEAEHEFVFSVGPTGGAESPGSRDGDS
jgi:methyl-accepting chemotaxis protein